MTEITRATMITATIAIVLVLLVSSFFIHDKTMNTYAVLSEYNIKKENLSIKIDKLQTVVDELNNTLQQDLEKQNNLKNQIEKLKGQLGSSITSGSSTNSHVSNNPSTSSSQPTPNPQPVPAPVQASPPAPSPPPAPVTRAS